jgi:hypothetical protein
MLKLVSICAGLLAFVTTQVAAHQQEAELQRIPIPGAAFDLVIATPKYPVRPIFDLSESPDALIVHLIGGELVLAFDDAEKMLQVAGSLGSPITAFHVMSKETKSRMPFAVYVAPKAE